MVNWGEIYETIYLCSADTVLADAFRRAAGLPAKRRPGAVRFARSRESVYAGVDFDKLMGQRYGVRM